ncbi:shikimate kinase [Limosilactobacillus difficilis]|uniref:shikimate kinase n=1 Tax=Limosilactobacillus difficilis TaxID=2991838 RepID=UPI0024BA79F1|nr:shikimate kinase [Limosilactobacillus difficilis]
MKIILTGFMASGKSSVGQMLAQRLSCPYTDLDQVVTITAGKSIPQIFHEDGEAAFRKLEHDQLAAVIDQGGILATGGGTPVRADNQEILIQSPALVVLLETSPEIIAQRLQQQSGRPLGDQLNAAGIAALQKQRASTYHRVADLVISTDQLAVETICQQIIDYQDNN